MDPEVFALALLTVAERAGDDPEAARRGIAWLLAQATDPTGTDAPDDARPAPQASPGK